MIEIIQSKERHHRDLGWLSTYWHFSFDDYYDPANMNWGALRVFNDDIIQPGQGFGAHPHRDMEIVTYVLDGALEHQDNQGNRGVIHAGEVQVMSAPASSTPSITTPRSVPSTCFSSGSHPGQKGFPLDGSSVGSRSRTEWESSCRSCLGATSRKH